MIFSPCPSVCFLSVPRRVVIFPSVPFACCCFLVGGVRLTGTWAEHSLMILVKVSFIGPKSYAAPSSFLVDFSKIYNMKLNTKKTWCKNKTRWFFFLSFLIPEYKVKIIVLPQQKMKAHGSLNPSLVVRISTFRQEKKTRQVPWWEDRSSGCQ